MATRLYWMGGVDGVSNGLDGWMGGQLAGLTQGGLEVGATPQGVA